MRQDARFFSRGEKQESLVKKKQVGFFEARSRILWRRDRQNSLLKESRRFLWLRQGHDSPVNGKRQYSVAKGGCRVLSRLGKTQDSLVEERNRILQFLFLKLALKLRLRLWLKMKLELQMQLELVQKLKAQLKLKLKLC